MKRLFHRGAMLIEYALLFALIGIVGIIMVDDKGIANSIKSVFNTTSNVLDKANSKNQGFSFNGLTDNHCWTSKKERYETGSTWTGGFSSKELVKLEQGTYEISFDLNKFKDVMGDDKDYSQMEFFLMGYTRDENGKNKNLVLDNGTPTETTAADRQTYVTTPKPITGSDGISRYTLENNGETINLGVNFRKSAKNDSSYTTLLNGKDQATLDKALNESLTITRK